jgi:putative ABC transport system substrate-binding protein
MIITRATLTVVLALSLLAAPLAAAAQAPARVPRIAFLAGGSMSSDALLVETFWQRLKEMKVAAGALRVGLQPLELRALDDVEPAFSAIKGDRAHALIVNRNLLTVTHRTRIVNLVARSGLPAMYGDKEFVDAGGLMSYGVNVADLWGRAAMYVDKILKGAKPADLPVERSTKFELVINMKTAKALGLAIPPPLLLRADRVIE